MNEEEEEKKLPENNGEATENNNSEEQYAFNWSWTPDGEDPLPVSAPTSASATAAPQKKKRSAGFVFAMIAVGVFAVAFVVLAIALASDIVLSLSDGDPMSNQVNINVSSLGPTTPEDGRASPEELESFKDSVVVVLTKTATGSSTGTGIIMSEDGYIATNYHVVENATTIEVKLYNGHIYEADYIGGSESDDLAVIKINAPSLIPATFGQSKDCSLGETVYAVGTPAGADFGWTVTTGSVSCVLRDVKIYDETTGVYEKTMSVIQTDVSVNPGNSGGPLINSRCEVIGIITMKLSNGYEGMGFAIPSDGALEILVSIIENGNADNIDSSVSQGRPLIGIVGVGVEGDTWYRTNENAIESVSEAYANQYPDETFYAAVTGVIVRELTPGLDAENKLEVGDIITEVNGTEVYSIYDVIDLLSTLKSGDEVELRVYRDGSYFKTNVTLG